MDRYASGNWFASLLEVGAKSVEFSPGVIAPHHPLNHLQIFAAL